jgi:hypothetical protein
LQCETWSWSVGVTAGSREIPRRKPVTTDDNDNNNNVNNNNVGLYIYIRINQNITAIPLNMYSVWHKYMFILLFFFYWLQVSASRDQHLQKI